MYLKTVDVYDCFFFFLPNPPCFLICTHFFIIFQSVAYRQHAFVFLKSLKCFEDLTDFTEQKLSKLKAKPVIVFRIAI